MNFANVNTALVMESIKSIFNLCDVSRAIQENMLCRVPVHLLEAEQELDGLVRAADLLHPLDLESVEYRVTRRLEKMAKFFKIRNVFCQIFQRIAQKVAKSKRPKYSYLDHFFI
jgi:hypothetical protein